MKTTQTTDVMTLEQILPGEQGSVLLSETTEDAQGQRRPFQQRVVVSNHILWHRLLTEAKIGEKIAATLVTEWRASSSVVRLTDFQVVSVAASAPQLRVA